MFVQAQSHIAHGRAGGAAIRARFRLGVVSDAAALGAAKEIMNLQAATVEKGLFQSEGQGGAGGDG